MDSLEVRAKTVEEATLRALDQLGLTRDEVEVVVVKEGRGGILGLGAEDAVIRVTPIRPPAKAPTPDKVQESGAEQEAREVLQ